MAEERHHTAVLLYSPDGGEIYSGNSLVDALIKDVPKIYTSLIFQSDLQRKYEFLTLTNHNRSGRQNKQDFMNLFVRAGTFEELLRLIRNGEVSKYEGSGIMYDSSGKVLCSGTSEGVSRFAKEVKGSFTVVRYLCEPNKETLMLQQNNGEEYLPKIRRSVKIIPGKLEKLAMILRENAAQVENQTN